MNGWGAIELVPHGGGETNCSKNTELVKKDSGLLCFQKKNELQFSMRASIFWLWTSKTFDCLRVRDIIFQPFKSFLLILSAFFLEKRLCFSSTKLHREILIFYCYHWALGDNQVSFKIQRHLFTVISSTTPIQFEGCCRQRHPPRFRCFCTRRTARSAGRCSWRCRSTCPLTWPYESCEKKIVLLRCRVSKFEVDL